MAKKEIVKALKGGDFRKKMLPALIVS
jgi:hypothetical protein